MAAPSAAVELIAGFANTVDLESGRDELSSPSGLARWLVDAALVEREPTITEADLQACVDLRSGMREALNDGGASASPHRLAQADAVLARLPVLVTLTATPSRSSPPPTESHPTSVVAPAPELGTVSSALARLAVAWIELVLTGRIQRLKRCAEQQCGEVFWDTSRNHSRRWCSMQVCGNRSKVRRHTARTTASRSLPEHQEHPR